MQPSNTSSAPSSSVAMDIVGALGDWKIKIIAKEADFEFISNLSKISLA